LPANPETVSYALSYGPSGSLSAVTFTGNSAVITSSASRTIGTVTKELHISTTGNADLASGSYTDLLTLTISAP
jgi:hypothetical protein